MIRSLSFNHSLLLLITILIVTVYADQAQCDYDTFLSNCGRANQIISTSQLYQARRQQYRNNCMQALQHNSNPQKNYTIKLYCDIGDLNEKEVLQKRGLRTFKTNLVKKTSYSVNENENIVSFTILPSSYNYVTLGYVTSVKDQGYCGSCWAFAATAMYESLLLRRGYSFGLSEQAALQCTSKYSLKNRVSDCNGGYLQDVMIFLARVGSVLRSQYPYISYYHSGYGYKTTPGICTQSNRISLGDGVAKAYGPLSVSDIKKLLINEGPLMVGVYSNSGFSRYSGGVYDGCPSYSQYFLNHAVLLVGYDDASSSWLIKNQWDTIWGENGYMRLSYYYDCGLYSYIYNINFTRYNADPRVGPSNNATQDAPPVYNYTVLNQIWESATLFPFLTLVILTLSFL